MPGVDMIDEANNESSQESTLTDDVMDSLGVNQEDDAAQSKASPKDGDDLPAYAKEKIGKLNKRHQKQVRDLQGQIQDLKESFSHLVPDNSNQPMNPYTNEPIQAGSEEERIHKAVSYALKAKEMEEQKAKNQEKVEYVRKKAQGLQDELDNASNEYEDFDDVVRNPDAPYTQAMHNAALLLPNAAAVLYKLGKDPEQLRRISELHPLEQQREMVKLSHALMSGNGSEKINQQAKPISSVKNNPVPSQNINEKTSVSELRRRMKSNWK